MECFLQPVEDLIGPETLQPMQRFVERRELVGSNAFRYARDAIYANAEDDDPQVRVVLRLLAKKP